MQSDEDQEFYEKRNYGESSVSTTELEIISFEDSVKTALSKKWAAMKLAGTPSYIFSVYDKIPFPERKHVTVLILASLIVSNGKINEADFQKTITRFKDTMSREKIRPIDIYRYSRLLVSLA